MSTYLIRLIENMYNTEKPIQVQTVLRVNENTDDDVAGKVETTLPFDFFLSLSPRFYPFCGCLEILSVVVYSLARNTVSMNRPEIVCQLQEDLQRDKMGSMNPT